MRNILVRRDVYPWTISPEPRKDLGSPTDNSVRSADAIELKLLYVGHISLKRVIGWHLEGHLGCQYTISLYHSLPHSLPHFQYSSIFLIFSSAIISFLCTAFLGVCFGTCFAYIVDIQNIITVFAHNSHKIITCKNNEYI